MNFKSNPKRKPGKNRPASSRRLIQGPQLRDFTKESRSSKAKPSDSDFVVATRGSDADAFFGASPVVASALGIRLGATPDGRIHLNIHPSTLHCKADISIWQTTGHFYLALAAAL